MKIYAVKDTVIGKFMSPFYNQNDNTAKRSFEIAINSPGEIAKLYKDLQLYRLGEFDEDTGEIKSDMEFLLNGTDVKKGE